MSTTTSLNYTIELPTEDLKLFKSLVKKFGWTARKAKKNGYADTVSPSSDDWWNSPENVAMVNEGSEQLKQGQGVVLSNDEMRKRLGL